MNLSGLFRKANNINEGASSADISKEESIPADVVKCSGCGKDISKKELRASAMVCPVCGYHFRLGARKRIELISDPYTFIEMSSDIFCGNIIDFPGYDEKLESAKSQSKENESVICGVCRIGGWDCVIFAMEPKFMMGSMGTAAGERITRAFEYAQSKNLPVVGFTASGGARMQEGIYSLMQMAKISGAVRRHSDAGGLYITVLTDPTTGGVTASFAMEGDIILAEPQALVAFAGKRVIEQTTGGELPDGFQKAEFLLEHGFIDSIVRRDKLKETLSSLLGMHNKARR